MNRPCERHRAGACRDQRYRPSDRRGRPRRQRQEHDADDRHAQQRRHRPVRHRCHTDGDRERGTGGGEGEGGGRTGPATGHPPHARRREHGGRRTHRHGPPARDQHRGGDDRHHGGRRHRTVATNAGVGTEQHRERTHGDGRRPFDRRCQGCEDRECGRARTGRAREQPSTDVAFGTTPPTRAHEQRLGNERRRREHHRPQPRAHADREQARDRADRSERQRDQVHSDVLAHRDARRLSEQHHQPDAETAFDDDVGHRGEHGGHHQRSVGRTAPLLQDVEGGDRGQHRQCLTSRVVGHPDEHAALPVLRVENTDQQGQHQRSEHRARSSERDDGGEEHRRVRGDSDLVGEEHEAVHAQRQRDRQSQEERGGRQGCTGTDDDHGGTEREREERARIDGGGIAPAAPGERASATPRRRCEVGRRLGARGRSPRRLRRHPTARLVGAARRAPPGDDRERDRQHHGEDRPCVSGGEATAGAEQPG